MNSNEKWKGKKVVLLHSGSFKTQLMIKWLYETYGVHVITLTLDTGNADVGEIQDKALKTGAIKTVIIGNSGAPDTNAMLAQKAAELAENEKAAIVIGKGPLKKAVEAAIKSLNSELNLLEAEWDASESELQEFAEKYGIPIERRAEKSGLRFLNLFRATPRRSRLAVAMAG